MAIAQAVAGARILISDLNAYYSLLKGSAGETITLVYNAVGSLIFQPSSDPAGTTQLVQIKNNAGTLKSALTAAGGGLFSSQVLLAKGADVASSGTTDLSAATGNYVHITGTTTITAFGTAQAGTVMVLEFDSALMLTHNATSLILRSATNATTAAGDIYTFVSEGSGNWREISHLNTAAASSITVGTEQASTSGTSIDFTGLPASVKRITINLVGVSTNGTSDIVVQLGDSGGIETSGYLGTRSTIDTAVTSGLYTASFGIALTAAASIHHGTVTLTLEDATQFTWVSHGVVSRSDAAQMNVSSGSKSTSAALDRVRITTAGGTDAFDAGAINITYE